MKDNLGWILDKTLIQLINLIFRKDQCVIALLTKDGNRVAYLTWDTPPDDTHWITDAAWFDNHRQALGYLKRLDALYESSNWTIASLGKYSDEEIRSFLVNKDFLLIQPRFKLWDGITIKEIC